MATSFPILLTIEAVRDVLGIPCTRDDFILYVSYASKANSPLMLEEQLVWLLVGYVFLRTFLIFACATILVPNSKLEGLHDLWDYLSEWDVHVDKN